MAELIIQLPPGMENPPPVENATAPLFTDQLTPEMVQLRSKEAAEDQALDAAKKEQLKALYQQAMTYLSEATSQESKAAVLAQKLQTIPTQVEELKKLKQSLTQPAKITLPEKPTLVQLQQELQQSEESLSNFKKQLDEIVGQLKNSSQRGDLLELQKSTQDKLNETEQQIRELPGIGTAIDRPTLAERTKRRARWQLLKATLAGLEQEDAWRKRRWAELLPYERDIAAGEVARLEGQVQSWRAAVAKERQAELDRQKAQAEAQARRAQTFDKYSGIANHANEIVELAELRQATAARIPKVVKQLDQTTITWKSLQDRYEQSRERVAVAGATMNVGTLLRLQQKKLPNLRELERSIIRRQDEIQQIQLASYGVNDRTKELASVPKATEELLDQLSPAPDKEERARLQSFVEELLETEKTHLDNLNADYNDLLDKLWRLDKVEKQLIEETGKYSQFISEHVLWIRSTDPLWKHSFQDYRAAFGQLLQGDKWASVLTALARDFWENPGVWTLSIALFGLLFLQQRKLKKQIDDVGKNISKQAMTEFKPTARVLRDTFFVAILWPSVLCWVGYRLSQQLDTSSAVSAVGSALFALGLVYFPVELLRQSCRSHGLVQSHFRWPAPVVAMIRRNLRWLKIVAPPFSLVAALFHSAEGDATNAHESLGRFCFVVGVLLAALFLHRVLRPSGAVFRALVAQHKGGWIERLRHVFYAAGVLVPVALAALAVVGYYYTAEQLVTRFYATALLTLFVLLLDSLIQRWLLVTRRRLALEQLQQRREAALALAQSAEAAEGGTAAASQSPVVPTPVETLDDRFDVSAMNQQTRHLVRSVLFVFVIMGLYGAWVDVLPALAVLKKVKIHALTIERVIEEQVQPVVIPNTPETDVVPPGENAPEKPPETVQKTIKVPITLADLMLSMILLVVAIGAARNLPGMLEMIVLQRLPIDNAARYAITTLAQYALMTIGISASFYVAGLRWQNVQWLAAALMVGLGFGLQEIFANFFSGLIVLLERPVRVGDIVSVGNTTGIVTKIRMRATTITNWERQEMIIPNKDLITGTVLNWTLSDTIQRVFIQVGVAYGSDTDKVTEVLYQVLKSHAQVLEEPPPMVTFAGFGDSTLNFEVRCFLPTASVKLATTHELHLRIDKAFREAGLEIAFPQCDLHIRSSDVVFPVQQISHSGNGSGPSHARDSAYSKGA